MMKGLPCITKTLLSCENFKDLEVLWIDLFYFSFNFKDLDHIIVEAWQVQIL